MWKVYDGRFSSVESTLEFAPGDGEAALETVQSDPEHLWLEFDRPDAEGDAFLEAVYDGVNERTGFGVTVLDIYVRSGHIEGGVYVTEIIEALDELVAQGKIVVSLKRDALTTLYTRTGSMTYE